MKKRRKKFQLKLIAQIVFLLATAQFARASGAGNSGSPPPDTSQEVYLSIEFSEGIVAAESLITYQIDRDIYLPSRQLFSSLGLNFEVNPPGIIKGAALQNFEALTLSVKDCSIRFRDKTEAFDCKEAFETEEDIYLSIALTQKLIPAILFFDSLASKIVVTTQTPFPPQLQQKRMSQKVKFFSKTQERQADDDFKSPIAPNLTGAGLGYTFANPDIRSNQSTLDLTSTARILQSETAFQGRYFDGQLSSQFFQMKWANYDRELNAFDFSTDVVPMFGSPGILSGFSYDSAPDWTPSQDLNWSIEDSLTEGWEVEIFQNEALIGRARSEAGRYRFDNIILNPGMNKLILKFYGPQGQTREETRIINLDSEQTSPRLIWKTFAGRSRRQEQIGLAQLSGKVLPQLRLSGAAVASDNSVTNLRNTYALLGGHFFLGPSSYDVSRWFDNRSSRTRAAVNLFFNRGLLTYSQTINQGLVAPWQNDREVPFKRLDQLKLFGSWNMGLPVQTQIQFNQIVKPDDEIDWDISFRNSTQIKSVFILYDRIRQSQVESDIGKVSLVSTEGSTSFRLETSHVGEKVSEIIPTILYRRNDKESAQLSGRKTWATEDTFEAEASLNYLYKNHLLSVSAGHTSSDSLKIGFLVSSNIWFTPKQPTLFSEEGILDQVPIRIDVFEDVNQNGVKDETETGREGVKFVINGQTYPVATDASGFLIIPAVPVRSALEIAVSLESLKDPFLNPDRDVEKLFLLSGSVSKITIPLIRLGEISGDLQSPDKYLKLGGYKLVVSSIDNPKIEFSTFSQSDGFFYFTKIPQGRYRVRIDPEQLKQRSTKLSNLNLELETEISVTTELSQVLQIQIEKISNLD